jgi:DNA polymerase III gamma/tau subunit
MPPSRDRYKIFIIDEVHMLDAGNALLKVLEGPPHVVFHHGDNGASAPATILSDARSSLF